MITGPMLARMLRKVLNPTTMLRLYVEASDEQIVEVQGGGYAAEPIPITEWTITQGPMVALAEGPVRLYRFNGDVRIRVAGAFLSDTDGGALWVEPFPQGPIDVGRRGDVIPVRPVMKIGPIS